MEAPVVGRVVNARAADRSRVPQGRSDGRLLGFLCRIVAKGLRVLHRVVGDAGHVPILEFIVLEIGRRQSRALLEQHDREAGLRQLASDHAARGARADDGEIDLLRSAIGAAAHAGFTASMAKPG